MQGTRLTPFGTTGIITYNRVCILIDGKQKKKQLFAEMGESIEVSITC